MTITLYQYELSPFADKVRRVMRLKGVAFDTVEVPISRPGMYRHVSPTGKFPALLHEGRTIVDSTDILHWLERHAPEPPMVPAAPRDRALAIILEDWADESLYFHDLTMRNWPQNRAWFVSDLLTHEAGVRRGILAALIPGALGKVARTQGLGRKSQADVTAGLAALYDALAGLLDGDDWLAGPRLSSADISVRVMVNVLERTVEGLALLLDRAVLAAWAERVDAVAPPEGLSVTVRR